MSRPGGERGDAERACRPQPVVVPGRPPIAFTKEADGGQSLAVIRTDGSDMRTLSGDLASVNVGGPDTWSPDGTWIYFGDPGRVYRANVAGGFTQRLTGDDLGAYAPASSPDGTLIAFIVDHNQDHWDLFVANSDGTGAHRLLEYAENDGWSADGRYVLAQWNPTDQPGGLAVVRPDGSEFRVVLPFDALVDHSPASPLVHRWRRLGSGSAVTAGQADPTIPRKVPVDAPRIW